jgi:tetratricopeptide (TPR) repeat protein
MADSRRHDPVPPLDAEIRDSQVEALLVDGLESYFKGRYEEAIHLWTRVLFLDRSHARARAYIDRAQAAVAERQRRGEELLQASQEFLDQGQTDAARDLLREIVSTGGDDERAAALRLKLERLERVHAANRPAATPNVPKAEVVQAWRRPRRAWAIAGTVAVLVVITVAGSLSSPTIRGWMGLSAPGEGLVARTGPVALPVLSTSDVALVRARTFYGRGRLAEALQALDRVGVDSASRVPADALRVEIQRLLLASAAQRAHGGDHP